MSTCPSSPTLTPNPPTLTPNPRPQHPEPYIRARRHYNRNVPRDYGKGIFEGMWMGIVTATTVGPCLYMYIHTYMYVYIYAHI